MVNIIVTKAMR